MNYRLNIFLKLTVCLVLCTTVIYAQPATYTDSKIDALVSKHIAINQKKQTMPGYRIQIYFGSKRDVANDIKNNFTQNYPDIKAYLSYQQPNFKVRVGDCKTRLEAVKILENIKSDFEVAFIVKDDVKLPDIK